MSKVISTEKMRLEFATAGGREYSFSLEHPDKALTEDDVLAQANAVIASGVVKVDGEPLAAVRDISIVKTEKTVYDIDRN